MTRILIVHEIHLICEMIAASLKSDPTIEVAGCATNLEEAQAIGAHCDVILVSSALPNGGALAVTQAFKSIPSVAVVVLGLPESEPAILPFIEAGAVGYVSRENSAEELLETIHTVSAGEARVSPAVAAALIARMSELADWVKQSNGLQPNREPSTNLTERECQVLALVAEGCSNQEIARRLTIELGTVKNHVHNILRKLNVTSREEAAACLPWIETRPVDGQYARRSTDRLAGRPMLPRMPGRLPGEGKQDSSASRYNAWTRIPASLP
jgi:two-component system nitrate/nitrite response regulator NarL